jgi:hypothetical protein
LFGSRSKINLEWERWFYVLKRKGAAQEFSEIAGVSLSRLRLRARLEGKKVGGLRYEVGGSSERSRSRLS